MIRERKVKLGVGGDIYMKRFWGLFEFGLVRDRFTVVDRYFLFLGGRRNVFL